MAIPAPHRCIGGKPTSDDRRIPSMTDVSLNRNFHLCLKSSRNECSPSIHRPLRSPGVCSWPSGDARGIRNWHRRRHLNPDFLLQLAVFPRSYVSASFPGSAVSRCRGFLQRMFRGCSPRWRETACRPGGARWPTTRLHHALDQAAGWGMIPRNVCDVVPRPRALRPAMQVLTPEQVNALLEAARGGFWRTSTERGIRGNALF